MSEYNKSGYGTMKDQDLVHKLGKKHVYLLLYA